MVIVTRFRFVQCGPEFDETRYLTWYRVLEISFIVASAIIFVIGMVANYILIFSILKSTLRRSLTYQLLVWIAIGDGIRFMSVSLDFTYHYLETMCEGMHITFIIIFAIIHGVTVPLQDAVLNGRKYVMSLLSIVQLIIVMKPMINVKNRVINAIAGLIYFTNSLLVTPTYFLFTANICQVQGKFISEAEISDPLWNYRVIMEVYTHTAITWTVIGTVSYLLLRVISNRNKKTVQMNIESISVTKSILKMNLIFLFGNIPQIVFGVLFNTGYQPGYPLSVRNLILNIAVLISCLNCSFNFFIYYGTDKRFKNKCRNVMGGKVTRSKSEIFSTKMN